jgi:hypothetical protein
VSPALPPSGQMQVRPSFISPVPQVHDGRAGVRPMADAPWHAHLPWAQALVQRSSLVQDATPDPLRSMPAPHEWYVESFLVVAVESRSQAASVRSKRWGWGLGVGWVGVCVCVWGGGGEPQPNGLCIGREVH